MSEERFSDLVVIAIYYSGRFEVEVDWGDMPGSLEDQGSSHQGSSTSSCARMALLGQFRQAENVTRSSDEMVVLQKL